MARGDYRGRVRAESADEVGELARAFNQMATELDTVDQEQRALVATVSHELRTPLAGLTAVLENLADGVVPADEAHLQAAVGQARRLSDLVGDLLELSRVDAGVAPLRLADVDVADAARRDRRRDGAHRPGRQLRRRRRRRAHRAGRPGPAAAAGRQPARQRRPARTRPRHGPGPRHHGRRALAARDRRRRSWRAVRRPRARVRAVRHPRPRPEQHGRRRHRPRARHRPLGGHAARRHRPLRRPTGRDDRAPCSASTCRSTRPSARPSSRSRCPSPSRRSPCPHPYPPRRRPPSTYRPWSTRSSAGTGPTYPARAGPWSWPRSAWACWPGC